MTPPLAATELGAGSPLAPVFLAPRQPTAANRALVAAARPGAKERRFRRRLAQRRTAAAAA